MGISRQEYWSELPCSSPGDLPNTGTESRSPTLQVDSLLFEPPGKPELSHIPPQINVSGMEENQMKGYGA